MTDEEILRILDGVDERLRFTPGNHTYRLDKKPIVSVTTALKEKNKEGVNIWRVNVQQEADIRLAWNMIQDHEDLSSVPYEQFQEMFKKRAGKIMEGQKQMEAAGDLGSQIHALVEKHLKDQLGIPFEIDREITDKAQELFVGLLAWMRSVDLRPIFVERRVFHEGLWYAGTIDLGAEVEGEKSILDWKGKTQKHADKLWMEQAMQNVAYREAAKELGLGEWTGHIVSIPREGGEIKVHKVEPKPGDAWTKQGLFSAFMGCIANYRESKAFER